MWLRGTVHQEILALIASTSEVSASSRLIVKIARRPINFDFETNALALQTPEQEVFERTVDAALVDSRTIEAVEFVRPTFMNVRLSEESLVHAYSELTSMPKAIESNIKIQHTEEVTDCLTFCRRLWQQSTGERFDIIAMQNLPPILEERDSNPSVKIVSEGLSLSDKLGAENRRLLVSLNEFAHFLTSKSNSEVVGKCVKHICSKIRSMQDASCIERPTFGITTVRATLIDQSRKMLEHVHNSGPVNS